MNISGIDGIGRNGNQIGAGAGEDAKTKSIKDQIARVQKKLQDLAANEDISLEEKMKKRQELQKQLSDLNSQLRQCQIEQRKKASEAKQSRQESDGMGSQAKTGRKQEDPEAEVILTAGAALKQAKVQDGVIAKQKGCAGVLEAEIRLDSSRGRSVEAKQEEPAKVEARMTGTQSLQMENLGRANQAIEESRRNEGQPETERESEEKKAGKPNEAEKTGSDRTEKLQAEEEKEDKENVPKTEENRDSEREAAPYRPINILL